MMLKLHEMNIGQIGNIYNLCWRLYDKDINYCYLDLARALGMESGELFELLFFNQVMDGAHGIREDCTFDRFLFVVSFYCSVRSPIKLTKTTF